MDAVHLHIFTGWVAMLFGALSGATIGLYFHEDDWAGGYNSFRRRMLRLGHISFFGLGFVNLLYGLALTVVPLSATQSNVASTGFIIGVNTMPLCCFLSAWRKPFRHFFAIPVLGVITGLILALVATVQS